MDVLRRVWCRLGRHAGQWSPPDARCEQARVCPACGGTQLRDGHVWSPFGYVTAGGCAQSRRCGRCGRTETRTVHAWGPWAYQNTDFASPQMRACGRCATVEVTRPTAR